MSSKLTLVVLAAFLLLPAAALADSCNVTVIPVNFGTYVPVAASPRDSTGTVTLTCASHTGGAVISLNAGTKGGGGFTSRGMSNGLSRLSYQLYADAAHSRIWGDSTGGSVTVALAQSGSATIYGRIPAKQPVSAGTYTDTVLITFLF